jgi:ATP-binding cassette subfamily F protein uup
MALISLKDVSLRYGGLPLLDSVEFHIEQGDRICLLGSNGAGKSSLLRVLAGDTAADSGQVITSPGIRVTRLPQQVPANLAGRIIDIVCPEHASEARGREALESRQILSRLQLDPLAEFAPLSGGTRRRVLLAKALLGTPDLVLLDEPTNHLDLESITFLENFLLRYCRTFVFVTHDRAFLRRLATRVVELDRGRLSDWACDYDTFLRRKEETLQAEAQQWEKLDKRLEKEEAWIRRGVKARAIRNQGRVRALETLRAERARRRELGNSVQLSIQEAGRTGQVVIKAGNVTFGYGADPLIRDFSLVLGRGDRVGILGPNGCGKTTLLRLLLEPAGTAGGLTPGAGRVTHGTNLQICYSDQLRAQLDDSKSLIENVAEGKEFIMIDGLRRHVMGYLEDFCFEPDRARQPASVLSGGERSRLLLARLFAQPSNVLVLDEPTNDLDLDTLTLLEERLAAYQGTVLLVSHDRAFLNNVVTSVLAFEKHPPARTDVWLGPLDGWYVNEYVGGYDDWADRRVLPPEAEPPRKSAPIREKKPVKKRLSQHERRELDGLPSRIEALEIEQAQLHQRMSESPFYRLPPAEIAAAKARSESLIHELEAAYARWEILETQAAQT